MEDSRNSKKKEELMNGVSLLPTNMFIPNDYNDTPVVDGFLMRGSSSRFVSKFRFKE